MKALVTGATGYVGSKLCARLLAEGWQVEAIIRAAGRPLPEPLADKVHLQAARLLEGPSAVPSHQRYSVSTGQARTLREVVKAFVESTGQNVVIRWGERHYRAREVMAPSGEGDSPRLEAAA